ncbi:hypothetical protein Q5P01_007884 [Channa striata]|uniref:Uncharacterized protein n=1 Tax=Channa striata TaxID=64152 RepID=A0AA88T2D5_CHASR|nr:hypothetical protein Q5P01_007884 [Channa striata]
MGNTFPRAHRWIKLFKADEISPIRPGIVRGLCWRTASPSGRCRYSSLNQHVGESSHGTNDLEAEVTELVNCHGTGG